MHLPMLTETHLDSYEGAYKIFSPKRSCFFFSFHMVLDIQGSYGFSLVLGCVSLLLNAHVFKSFSISLLEGSCQARLQNVLKYD